MKINILLGIAVLILALVNIVRGKFSYHSWFSGEQKKFTHADNPTVFWSLIFIQVLIGLLILFGHRFLY